MNRTGLAEGPAGILMELKGGGGGGNWLRGWGEGSKEMKYTYTLTVRNIISRKILILTSMYCSYYNPYTLCAELYLVFLISYGWLRVLVHLHNAFLHGHSHTLQKPNEILF